MPRHCDEGSTTRPRNKNTSSEDEDNFAVHDRRPSRPRIKMASSEDQDNFAIHDRRPREMRTVDPIESTCHSDISPALPAAQIFLPAVCEFWGGPRDEKATYRVPRHCDEGSTMRTQIEKFSSVDPVDLPRHRDKGSASRTQIRVIPEWRIPWGGKNPRLVGRFLPSAYTYYRNLWNPEKPSPTVTWDMESDKEPVPRVKLRVTQLMTRHFKIVWT